MIIEHKPEMRKKGFTLIELLVVMAVLGILVATVSATYVVGIKTWGISFDRSNIRGKLSQSMELITRNLRQAKSIDALTESSIIFSGDWGLGNQTCYLYLHNDQDSLPNPPYSQDYYNLRYTCGSTTYGDGRIIVERIMKPTHVVFSQSGSLITIDLIASKSDVVVRMRSSVRPRNL